MQRLKRLARRLITARCKLMADDLTVGRYSYLNVGCSVRGQVSIGHFCAIGRDVTLQARNHQTDRPSQQRILYDAVLDEPAGFESAPIEIGHDVWIASGATVLPGVTVGTGAVIGAGAVVTDDVAPYAVVGGVPAERIRWRFPERVRERLLDTEWWHWDDEQLRDHSHWLMSELPTDSDAQSRDRQQMEVMEVTQR